jgi:hypothetical protein
MDLSKNSLYGTTPHYFHNMSFGRLVVDDPVYNEYPSMSWFERVVSTFQKLLEWNSEEITWRQYIMNKLRMSL